MPTATKDRLNGRRTCAGLMLGLSFGLAAPLTGVGVSTALAQRIENPIAVFNGLDKITGRIVSFEVGIGETVQFGALQLTPRACYTRPATETPNTTAFLEVDEVSAQGRAERLFTGWVFAASPGLHGIEHPVYDIWLTDCENPGASAQNAAGQAASGQAGAAQVGEQAGAPDPLAPPLPPPRPARLPGQGAGAAPAFEDAPLADPPPLQDPLLAPFSN